MANMLMKIATVTLLIAAPARAGEVTGSGSDTPVNNYQAASICSFSGLNDDAMPTSDRVQTYGMIVRSLGGGPLQFGPGTSCRGY